MPALDHLQPGDELEPLEDGPLSIQDFVRYQGASGDFNPVHYDATYACSAGFVGPFAVGMRQAGVAGSWLTNQFGVDAVRRFAVQWRAQAWPGDVLTYVGRVTDARGRGRQREVDLGFEIVRAGGAVHARGWATLVGSTEVG